MGTRCDLYVGRGKQAEWLGSYPWDAYPDGMPKDLLAASDEADFRRQVADYLATGGDKATLPAMGWPWPWENSQSTDYAYTFDGGKVWASCFGCEWFDPLKEKPEGLADKVAVFPDMSDRRSVTFGPRSGLIVMGA